MNNPPEGTFVVGNKLMSQCRYCRKILRVDKPIFGSLHICLSDEERAEHDRVLEAIAKQKNHIRKDGENV